MTGRDTQDPATGRSRIARRLEASAAAVVATLALGLVPAGANAANSPYYQATQAGSGLGSAPAINSAFPIAPLTLGNTSAGTNAPILDLLGATTGLGQGPSWGSASSTYATSNGGIYSTELDLHGLYQVYYSPENTSTHVADGWRQTCITCAAVQGPSGLPQERPANPALTGGGADWLLFESYGAQPTHFGNAGFGGYGGDLYAIRPNGSGPAYRLTQNVDPGNGAQFTTTSGTPYDNFHAYWSPDGTKVVWTHMEADPSSPTGGEKWELMVADFGLSPAGTPQLTNVTVVGQPYGAYEAESWSPDGQGFIFYASGGRYDPFQTTPVGWGTSRIYYMRISGVPCPGSPIVSAASPCVTPLISDADPTLNHAYMEQALFTPDEKDVILMSNAADPATSWTKEVMSRAASTGYDSDTNTGDTQTLQFPADFLPPPPNSAFYNNGADNFTTDLYMVQEADASGSPAWQPPIRLTRFTTPGSDMVIPEFYWNQDYTKLLWTTEDATNPSSTLADSQTYTANFTGASIPASPASAVPHLTPNWLVGTAPNWTGTGLGNLASQVRSPTVTPATESTTVAPTPPFWVVAPWGHALSSSDSSSIPSVAAGYATEWQGALNAIDALGSPPFLNLALRGAARF